MRKIYQLNRDEGIQWQLHSYGCLHCLKSFMTADKVQEHQDQCYRNKLLEGWFTEYMDSGNEYTINEAKALALKKINTLMGPSDGDVIRAQRNFTSPRGRAKPQHDSRSDRIQCPHCGKTGGTTGMKRWHFDNCPDKK